MHLAQTRESAILFPKKASLLKTVNASQRPLKNRIPSPLSLRTFVSDSTYEANKNLDASRRTRACRPDDIKLARRHARTPGENAAS